MRREFDLTVEQVQRLARKATTDARWGIKGSQFLQKCCSGNSYFVVARDET
jgi:hypothetical protein